MGSWFVEPEKKRLELSENNWIEIKKRLNVGEQRKVDTAGLGNMHGVSGKDYEIELKLDLMDFKRAEMYILGWSLRDKEDKPVPLTLEAITALDPDRFEEIKTAIDRHVEALEKEKKAKNGEPKQKAISSS